MNKFYMFKVCVVNLLSDSKQNTETQKENNSASICNMERNFYTERIRHNICARMSVSHLLANELLSQEFPSLKHVRNVVEWTETLVFVLVLLL